MNAEGLAVVIGDLLGWTYEQKDAFFLGLTHLGVTYYGGVIELAREVNNDVGD